MGTNYYAIKTCECCGNKDKYHIGKSSAGWVFSLHVEPDNGIGNFHDVLKIIKNPDRKIFDEYDRRIPKSELLNTIRNRSNKRKGGVPSPYQTWDEFHEVNDSIQGPNNLLRHKIKHNCIAHSNGTWDCIKGKFS